MSWHKLLVPLLLVWNYNIVINTSIFILGAVRENLHNLYNIVLWTGYHLFLGIKYFCSICYLIPCCVHNALLVLTEDFAIFAGDIHFFALFLWTYINETISHSVSSLRECIYLFVNGIRTVNGKFLDNQLIYILQVLKYSYNCVFDALRLIGSSTVYVIRSLYYFIVNLPEVFLLSYAWLKNETYLILSYIQSLLTHEALYGLITLSFFSIISHKLGLPKLIFSSCLQILIKLQLIIVKFSSTFCSTLRRLLSVRKKVFRPQIKDGSQHDLQKLLEQEKAAKLCIICMDNRRDAILMNCKHFVLCAECAHLIDRDTGVCPICRVYIVEVINVYT